MKVLLASTELREPPHELSGLHTVVVKDNAGNPIFVAVHQSDDTIWAITAEDPRFVDVVRELGISKRLSVQVG